MAIEQERMVVVLEARLDKLEKGFQKAKATSATVMGGIVTDANKMEAALARVGGGGFQRATQSAGALKAQTANISAQFQDIAVQLAGGQSPFLIALQQGTQLTAALGPGGLGSAIKALGGGFASLLNPMGLLTIGIISLGGIAVQKLLEWYNAGELTEKQLREQESLIRQVADRWGDALPAVQAYVAELDKIKDVAERNSAVTAVIGQQFEAADRSLGNFLSLMDGADFSAFNTTAMEAVDNTARLEQASSELEAKIKSGQDATQEFARVQALLSELQNSTAIQANGALRDSLNQLAVAYNLAAQEAGKLAAANAGIADGKVGRLEGLPLPESVNVVPERRVDPYFDGAAKKGGAKRDAAAAAAEREKQAVRDLISQLEFEKSLIGMTNLEREKANALRRAGEAATPAQAKRIAELTEQIYTERAAHEAAEAAIRRQKEAMEELGRIGMEALNGIVSALDDGKITGEEFIQIALRLAQSLSQMQGLGGLLGGGGGGFASLLGGLFGLKDGGRVARMASGGFVSGPGGPREDKIPALLSNGEYVVNAAATKRFGPMLDAINNGTALRLASGGMVGRPSGAVAGSSPQQLIIHLVGEEGEMFTPRVRSISGQTAGVVVQQARPQLGRDAVNSVQAASRQRPGLFR